ncbi:hypothetical protein H0920_06345 [Acinetobacter sp. C_4_1]|nr:hypothetical protein [Acinetobacter sp. F_3_1]MCT8097631.1 hypothetical protein [Acinetobacter sp. C_3_1]MCT8100724.1 hypothetical protein [Acinetobacter sp. C_4_1]
MNEIVFDAISSGIGIVKILIKHPYFDSNLVNRNPHVINGGGKISQETRLRTMELLI